MRVLLFAVCHALFRVRVRGPANLDPAKRTGMIVVGAPHRNWSEPALLLSIMPVNRRVVTVADARTVSGSVARRVLASATGGVIAVGAGSGAFADHLAAAVRTVDAGDILAIFPEVGPPSRPPELRRLSPGVARFAAASAAPVVPVVFGGTDELYLRRRIEVVVLPPLAPPANLEQVTIDHWMASLISVAQAAAADAQTRADARPARRRHWRWLGGNYPRA